MVLRARKLGAAAIRASILRFDGFDLAFEEGQAAGEGFSDGGRGACVARMTGAGFFRPLAGDEIAPAHHQLAETLLVLRGEFEAAQTGVPLGGEAGDGLGVEAAGLGCFAKRASKAMGLPRRGAMQGAALAITSAVTRAVS